MEMKKPLKIILIVISVLALIPQILFNIDEGYYWLETLPVLLPAAALVIAGCIIGKRNISFILGIAGAALSAVGIILSACDIVYPLPFIFCSILLLLCAVVCIIFNRPEAKEAGAKKADAKNENGVQKTKLAAIALNIAFGFTGAHRYYLGHKKIALIQTAGAVLAVLGLLLMAELEVLGLILMILGAVAVVWAVVDFFLILADKLLPADGRGYKPVLVSVVAPAPVEILEKLATLHQQGILTDEEFAQKKAELLSKI